MKNFLLFLLLLIPVSVCIGQEDNEKPFVEYEKMPQFPGGEAEMLSFIKKHFTYPQSATDQEIEGRVTIRFVVRKTGYVDNITIIRGIHPECDSVAISIIKKMPKWEPGGIYKDSVLHLMDTYFTLPIIFKLPYEIVDGEKIYTVADTMPQFTGGMSDLFNFIAANLKYPHQGMCVQGRVTIRFVVTKEGKVINPVVLRSLEPNYFDKEALRVIGIMPDWIPAKHNGENVNTYFTMPVSFRLSH